MANPARACQTDSLNSVGHEMHVITDFSATEGAQNMLSRLVRAGDSRATIVSLRGISERNRRLTESEQVRLVSLPIGGVTTLPIATIRLARLIRREKPAVIVCWLYHAMIVGVLAARLFSRNIRVIWTVRQSLDEPSALSRSTQVAIRVARGMSWMCDGIIYNSRRSLEQHSALGFKASNVTVIHNGFALPSPPSPAPTRAPRVVGTAGRFHPQKDYPTFFSAAADVAARYGDSRFVAAGRGVDATNSSLRSAVAATRLDPNRISFLGEVTDMAAFYRSVDIFVLSSRTEGFPNVVGEAMSYGLPVVATDVGDVALLVGPGGIVVPPGDPQALAAAIESIMELSPENYAALARNSRERIETHFAISAVAAEYRRFLHGS